VTRYRRWNELLELLGADGQLQVEPAAQALGVPAAHAVVFEDAQAGVAAGHAGHFALVVGVDRVGQAAELKAHGADIVVKDLSELLEDKK